MLKIMPWLILECQISLNFSAAKLEMQFRYQNKKYIQTYVTFRPDGRKSSTISGDVLYVNQVSEQ